MKKLLSLVMASLMILSLLAACGGNNTTTNNTSGNNTTTGNGDDTSSDTEVTTVRIGIGTDSMPNCYLDEDGNLAGENYEVMCLVDELLPQYEFEYETGTQDAIIIGLDTGTYAVGVNNFFYSEEREEKYLFPEYPISAGVRGLILRNEYKDVITEGTTEEMLSQVAKLGLVNVPYSSSESGYALYTEFNETHEEQLIFEVAEHDPLPLEVQQVINGRYDVISDMRANYTAIKEEADPNDETYFVAFNDSGFGTWVLYGQGQEELVAAVDGAMEQLFADGTMAAMSIKYYGENVYQYIEGFEYADVEPNPDYEY